MRNENVNDLAALTVGHVIHRGFCDLIIGVSHAGSNMSVRLSLEDAERLAERLHGLVEQLRSVPDSASPN